MKRKIGFLAFTLLIFNLQGYTQNTSYFEKFAPAKRWSVGLQLGPTAGHTDADEFKMGIAGGLHAKYSLSSVFGLKLSGNIGTLKGGRESSLVSNNGKNRFNQDIVNEGIQAPGNDNYSYKNNFSEVQLTSVFTLGNISMLKAKSRLQSYGFVGIGALWSNTEGNFTDPSQTPSYAKNEPVGFHDYEGTNLTVPFGVGLKYCISNLIDLGLEYRMNYTRSDYIDGFSYPVWRNRYTDKYSVLGIQVSFKIGSKNRTDDHYDWLNPVANVYQSIDSLESTRIDEDLLKDDDGDGVANKWDKEPNTAKGAMVFGNGVAADIDMDGVPDFKDKQLFSEKGADVDVNGVMIDEDEDGVPDFRDSDLKTPKDAIVDRKGIEITNLGSSGGMCCDCSNINLPSLQFKAGSSHIGYESHALLYQIAEKMKSCPDTDFQAIGYSYQNKAAQNLSEKRIEAIIDYLNAHYNIPRDRISKKHDTLEMDASGAKSRSIKFLKK